MKKGSFWKEIIYYTLFALLIVIPIRTWVAQPFIVNGSSMDPTFIDGEYLIVDEISYRFENPTRGDVVIFKYPMDPSKYFIKRLIGMPGETVDVKSGGVVITNAENPTGIILDESYTNSRTFGNTRITLAENEYFVMGDNRLVSSDSRVWGPLSRDAIVGKPLVRLLPITKIKLFPGEITNEVNKTVENK